MPATGSSIRKERADASADRRIAVLSSILQDRPSQLLSLASQLGPRISIVESAIRGGSMWPAIPSGARLRVQLLAGATCHAGDVVYYLAGDGYVVHRVVHRPNPGVTRGFLLTRGDSRITPDPPVHSDRVLGIVTAFEAGGRWHAPEHRDGNTLRGRAARAVSLALMIAALRMSPAFAGQLAAFLLAGEFAWRAARRRYRWPRGPIRRGRTPS